MEKIHADVDLKRLGKGARNARAYIFSFPLLQHLCSYARGSYLAYPLNVDLGQKRGVCEQVISFVARLLHELLRPYKKGFPHVPFSVDLNLERLNFLVSVLADRRFEVQICIFKNMFLVFFCSTVFKARSLTVLYSLDYLVGRRHGIPEATGNTSVTV